MQTYHPRKGCGVYTFRRLAKSPMFTVLSLLTLAIGIGANTAVFSVDQQRPARAAPYPNADELVAVWHTRQAPGRQHPATSACRLDVLHLQRARTASFRTWASGSRNGERHRRSPSRNKCRTLCRLARRAAEPRRSTADRALVQQADQEPEAAGTVMLATGIGCARFGGDPRSSDAASRSTATRLKSSASCPGLPFHGSPTST